MKSAAGSGFTWLLLQIATLAKKPFAVYGSPRNKLLHRFPALALNYQQRTSDELTPEHLLRAAKRYVVTMNNGRVTPIRTSNGSNPLRASDDAPTKMILAIGSRRFRIDAYVGFSELPPPKFADESVDKTDSNVLALALRCDYCRQPSRLKGFGLNGIVHVTPPSNRRRSGRAPSPLLIRNDHFGCSRRMALLPRIGWRGCRDKVPGR